MPYIDTFKSNKRLIKVLGEQNAHLIWVLGLYTDEKDLEALASEALTDGPNDKKIDFIYLNQEAGRLVFAQGYYAGKEKKEASANKAADLNTAAAWLFSGDLNAVPEQLKPILEQCRQALGDNEISTIELLFVHNLEESPNVARELKTVQDHLREHLKDQPAVTVSVKELGRAQIDSLFQRRGSFIEVRSDVFCPASIELSEKGPNWVAYILTVPGDWVRQIFVDHGEALFSANYRGFLGLNKRSTINTGIRNTAELAPRDFWVFNNGITLLTHKVEEQKGGLRLTGISIINGAQTTGSIGSVDFKRYNLNGVKVLCRVIECSDVDKISDIVKYNNTQNEIVTWDQYGNDQEQVRIEREFSELGISYSRKRGFEASSDEIGLEEVAQPLIAFHGRHQDANRGRNRIFERSPLYNLAFGNRKAAHILFVYTLAKAIDEYRIILKRESNSGSIVEIQEKHLKFLRNIRFKYYFIALTSLVMESVVGKRVDKERISFSEDAIRENSNPVIFFTESWIPILRMVLTFLSSQADVSAMGNQLADEGEILALASKVGALIHVSRESSESLFQPFSKLVTDR